MGWIRKKPRCFCFDLFLMIPRVRLSVSIPASNKCNNCQDQHRRTSRLDVTLLSRVTLIIRLDGPVKSSIRKSILYGPRWPSTNEACRSSKGFDCPPKSLDWKDSIVRRLIGLNWTTSNFVELLSYLPCPFHPLIHLGDCPNQSFIQGFGVLAWC